MRTPPRVMPALVTPFTNDGELDLESHRHNLRRLTEQGIKGFLIAGSTGEGAYLEPGEREELLRTARDELGRRTFLLGGVVAETERAARAQLAEIAASGADGALVITPTTLVRNRHPLVKRFYTDLADDAPVPLMLYSVPSYTAYPLPTEVAVELSEHPGIVGMKDSGGDPVRMGDLVAGCADGFFLFCGSSAALSQAVAAGAYGAITASANYAPTLVAEVVKRRRPGPWQRRLTSMSRGVEVHGVPGVKAAAAGFGLRPGVPRSPLRPVSRREAAGLADLVTGG